MAGVLTVLTVAGSGSLVQAAEGAPPAPNPPNPDPSIQVADPGAKAEAAPEAEADCKDSPKCWWRRKPCTNLDSDELEPWSDSCSGVFGVRGSLTRLRGVDEGKSYGLMAWTEGEEYVRRWIWSFRGRHKLGIGGGEAGFEGTLFGDWAGGVRIPVGKHHGPVARLGLHGYLRGNDDFYGSLLEVPQLQLGYQYMRGSTVLELGAKSGAVLLGRSRTGSARRKLGTGLEVGAYGALQLPWFRLGLDVTRLPVDDDLSTPVDVAEGTLCARFAPLAICLDGRATRTDAILSPGAEESKVRSVYAGLLIGLTREGERPTRSPAAPNAPQPSK